MDFAANAPGLEAVKAVFTDFDYTFLNSNHEVSELNAKSFRRLKDKGFVVGIASGRSRGGTLSCIPDSMNEIMQYKGSPGIFLNGAAVYDDKGELIAQTTVEEEGQKLLMQKMRELGILNNILGYTADRVCCLELNEYTEKSWKEYKEPKPEVLPLDGPNGFNNTRFVKLVVCGTVESTDKNRQFLESSTAGKLRCVRPLTWNLEFVSPLASKANGMKVLLSHLHLTPADILTMGDSENDIEMLQMARVSVAVANAYPRAKEVSKYVTVSCEESAFHAVASVLLQAKDGAESRVNVSV